MVLLGDSLQPIVLLLQDSLHVGVVLAKEGQFLLMGYIDPTHLHQVFLAAVEESLVALLASGLHLKLKSQLLTLGSQLLAALLEGIALAIGLLHLALMI